MAASGAKGFTLLEVLVALVFFALVGIVMQQVTASTVGQFQSIRMKMFGAWIAENKLTELRLDKRLPNPREYKEELFYANHEWELVSKVIATENPFIRRVEVEAYEIEEDGEKRRHTVLTGFVGQD